MGGTLQTVVTLALPWVVFRFVLPTYRTLLCVQSCYHFDGSNGLCSILHKLSWLSPRLAPEHGQLHGQVPSCNPSRPDTLSPSDLVFPYFNQLAPEIRAIIWEEHFLASIAGRPQVHFLFAEINPTRRRHMCTFPECEGRSYPSREFLERHSNERQ